MFCAPFSSNVRLAWTDDQKDVGTFARGTLVSLASVPNLVVLILGVLLAIFEKGPDAMKGKSFVCASAPSSCQEVANDYEKLTGEKVLVEPLSVKEGASWTAQDMGIDESVAKELEDVFGCAFTASSPLRPGNNSSPTPEIAGTIESMRTSRGMRLTR